MITMFLRSLLSLSIAALPVTSVWALAEGFYLGIHGGLSSSSYTGDNLKVDVEAPISHCPGCTDVALSTPFHTISPLFILIPDSGVLSLDDQGIGGRLYLGYKFYKILGIEGGYTRYADTVIKNVFQVDSDPSTTGTLPQLIGANARAEQQSLDFSAKLFMPLLDLFEIYGLVGIAYLDSFLPDKAQFEVMTQADPNLISHKMKITNKHHFNYELIYGFGIGYSFDDRFILGVTYQQVRPNATGIQSSSLVGIDTVFSFG